MIFAALGQQDEQALNGRQRGEFVEEEPRLGGSVERALEDAGCCRVYPCGDDGRGGLADAARGGEKDHGRWAVMTVQLAVEAVEAERRCGRVDGSERRDDVGGEVLGRLTRDDEAGLLLGLEDSDRVEVPADLLAKPYLRQLPIVDAR